MSTERRQREGMAPEPEEQDPLGVELGKIICKCCDEMGPMGCSICPVEEECRRLWQEEVEDVDKMNVTDFRQLDQKFAQLRRERDGILARRGQAAVHELT
jgi:adenine-specific DNA glycosylase